MEKKNSTEEMSASADVSCKEIVIGLDKTGSSPLTDEITRVVIVSAVDGSVIYDRNFRKSNVRSNLPVFREAKQEVQEIINSADLIITKSQPFWLLYECFLASAGIDLRYKNKFDIDSALDYLLGEYVFKRRMETEDWLGVTGCTKEDRKDFYDCIAKHDWILEYCKKMSFIYRSRKFQKALTKYEMKGTIINMEKFYTIKGMSALTGITYQTLWSRFNKEKVIPVIQKTQFGEANQYSLNQFAQILTLEEAENLPDDIKAEIRALRKDSVATENELLQDLNSRIDMLETRIGEQEKLIEELKKEIKKLAKKRKKK